MLKQALGWTSPKLRDPHAADRWTWLVLAAYTQLRLARGAVGDLRRPWERPASPEGLTPAGVRRGSGTCAAKPATPPARRNRPDQDAAVHPDYVTATR